MKLNAIMDNYGSRQDRKRKGRGIGSGKGRTAGRGNKGQRARAGAPRSGTFEGGQSPIFKRLPQIGFSNPFAKNYVTINLGDIQKFIEAGKIDAKQEITVEVLKQANIIRREKDGLKVLAVGELKTAINITAVSASKSAKEAIEKLGGKLTLVVKKTMRDRGAEEKGKLTKTASENKQTRLAKKVSLKSEAKKSKNESAKTVSKKTK